MANPLLQYEKLPDFKLIKAEHFVPAIQALIDENRQLVAKIKTIDSPTWQNSIAPLEAIDARLSYAFNIISHYNSVADSQEVRDSYDKVLPMVTELGLEIMQDEQLYQVFLQISQANDFANLNKAQQKVVLNGLRDFKLSGVNLPELQRKQFQKLEQEISELGNKFSKNILDATQAFSYHIADEQSPQLAGLPEQILKLAKAKAAQQNKPGLVFGIDSHFYVAIISYAKDRKLRETFYRAYNTRASDQGAYPEFDNKQLIDDIVQKRDQQAKLLGYANYAAVSIVPKMAKNTDEVQNFLQQLAIKAKPFAEREFASLSEFAKQDGINKLEAWDVGYYSELYRQQTYAYNEEELRPYFTEPNVMQGLFNLVERIFNLKITLEATDNVWDKHVKLYQIKDSQNNLRGKFYIDLYARDNKRGGAWMSELRSKMPGHYPVAFLVANLSPPAGNEPGLFTHSELETIFHEFGHTLHHLLTTVEVPSIAGTNGVAWDAVELPSQFMENWCYVWEVIKPIAKHYQTSQILDKAEFDKIVALKNYQAGMMMMRQLEFAMFDFRLHMNQAADHKLSVQQILDDVRAKVSVVPIPKFNRFQNNFSHIFNGGYAAGYYSYKWAEVLSCDAFLRFKEHGLFDKNVANNYLKSILEPGGSRDAAELFVEFMGREPNIDSLLLESGLS